MSAIIHKEIADGLRTIRNYISRFKYDGGLMLNSGETTRKFMKFLKDNNIPIPVFSWIGEAATKPRISGINTFATKLYSLFGLNDASQSTANSQPYISGTIAPNEKLCLKNNNGDSRYMTHPTISFSATDKWTVSTVVGWNGNTGGVNGYYAAEKVDSSTGTLFGFNGISGKLRIRNKTTLATDFGTYTYFRHINKAFLLTISSHGTGTSVSVFVNDVLVDTVNLTTNTAITLDSFFIGPIGNIAVTIPSHLIFSTALTTIQISSLHAWYKANGYLGYDGSGIAGVKIGNQVWASSNAEMVASPMGNLIANVSDNTAWAASKTTYNTVYAATSGTDEVKTYAAVKAAAMWSYYNNDVALGSTYGKLYNWYAVKLLQMDIDYYNAANPSTPWGWRVPTDTDFNTLATALGGASVAGGKMKKDRLVYWNSPNTGADNSSGFSALPGGRRTTDGTYFLINTQSQWWSLNSSDSDNASMYFLNQSDAAIANSITSKERGESLRLIKN